MPRPPSGGRFTDRYGPRRNPVTGRAEMHHGLDINSAAGRVLVAPTNVTLTGYGVVPGWEAHGQVARLIDHDGWEHWLSHTDTLTAGRRVGDQLGEGDPVALMGMTGQTTGLHVHWETRTPDGRRVDPESWLARPATTTPTTPVLTRRTKGKNMQGVIYTDDTADKERSGAIINTESGFVSTFGWFPPAYADNIAVGFGLTKAAKVTRGQYNQLITDARAIRS